VERPVATQLDHSGLLEPDCTGWSLLTWVNEVRIAEKNIQATTATKHQSQKNLWLCFLLFKTLPPETNKR